MSKIVDLTNQRFGRLVAVRKGEKKENRNTSYWVCACDCGNVVNIRVDHLRNEKIQSCGCIRKEFIGKVNLSHGMRHAPEYGVWCSMLKRCYNRKATSYHLYGGKGIDVCDEWCNSFEAFYRDMGSRPSAAHSIDRKDGAKGYCKDNCRWATAVEQANNISTNVYYTLLDERKTLAEWCREFEINYKTVHNLLRKRGFEFEDAINRALEIKKMRK